MKFDLNRSTLVGKLVRTPSLKETKTGTPVVNMTIAVNRSIKNGEEWEDRASFFDLVYYGKRAQSVHPFLIKGQQIGIDGYLDQNRWEQDGQKRSKVQIVLNSLQLLGPKPSNNFEDDPPF